MSAILVWIERRMPTLRAAFADLGHAAALLAFVTAATALKHTANNFPRVSAEVSLWSLVREAAVLGLALSLSLPVVVATCNLAPPHGARRLAWLAAGIPLAMLLAAFSPLPGWALGATTARTVQWQLAILVLLVAAVLEFRHRTLQAAGVLMRAEIDGVRADARLRDASLRVLQAQIAPHFLFNTLANVRRLAHIDRRAAAAMLSDLVHYFSVTLARRDQPQSTLREEAELVDAYFRIHRVRMGARLAYEVVVPAGLERLELPSMMLLTLAENAIKHGINPLAEGGFVRVRAERLDGMLHVEVADNGRGLVAAEGQGRGLANVRARLAILYGADAELLLAHGQPRGFVAKLKLPIRGEAA
ncbi:MAG TPA: histidine kinase [Gammaproteobacteria bacterium]|nr:histidine kinase [Gammaproteobacteria bacterium]